MQIIRSAAEFAAKAHSGMIRKGTKIPYINHLLETAVIVAQMTEEPEVIAAALLHDVLEDTDTQEAELKECFGGRVAGLVSAESEDKSKSWHERKHTTVEHLRHACRDEKILMLGDKLSNMRSTANEYVLIGDAVFERFNEKDKSCHAWYYSGVLQALEDLSEYPAYQELKRLYEFVFGA